MSAHDPVEGGLATMEAPERDAEPVNSTRRRLRAVASTTITVLACMFVWFTLVAPIDNSRLTPLAFVRIPLEGLLVVALLLALPPRARRIVAVLVGAVLGPLALVKMLDIGFFAALGRPFNPVIDWGYFGSAKGVLGDAIGRRAANITVAAIVLVVLALLVLMPFAVLRLSRVVDRHRTGSIRAVAALGLVWIVCATTGVHLVRGTPVASTTAARIAYEQVHAAATSIRDERRFQRVAAIDPLKGTPTADLLTGLRGKDVLFVFVESYGRVAVQDSSFSPAVDAVLDDGTKQLRAAGFDSRSAFLTSPTFGGISWLAHSTLQSGLWINNQLRYNELVKSDRFTLSDAFKRAGWRTVSDIPSDNLPWPQGTSFYHYDQLYNSLNVGYVGPKFGYAPVPDQYTMSTLQRLELAKPDRAPVMAEIDLVSSHTPWAPLPHMVGWDQLGDGSIYNGMPRQGRPAGDVWRHAAQVRASYGQSIQYSLTSLISFVQRYHDNNLVMVMLGDHQPSTIVSGQGSGRDVPITIIAHDPAVLDRIAGWGWQEGMRPRPDAPVWPMDSFRDRFLTAYGRQR